MKLSEKRTTKPKAHSLLTQRRVNNVEMYRTFRDTSQYKLNTWSK